LDDLESEDEGYYLLLGFLSANWWWWSQSKGYVWRWM